MQSSVIMKYMSVKEKVTGSWIATNMQVHHGGAGTTATGLKAGVMYFWSSVSLRFLMVSGIGIIWMFQYLWDVIVIKILKDIMWMTQIIWCNGR